MMKNEIRVYRRFILSSQNFSYAYTQHNYEKINAESFLIYIINFIIVSKFLVYNLFVYFYLIFLNNSGIIIFFNQMEKELHFEH